VEIKIGQPARRGFSRHRIDHAPANGKGLLDRAEPQIRYLATELGAIAGRLGGDEFAILFVKGDPNALRAKAERIRIVLLNTMVDLKGERVPIQASLGST